MDSVSILAVRTDVIDLIGARNASSGMTVTRRQSLLDKSSEDEMLVIIILMPVELLQETLRPIYTTALF